MAKFTKPRQLSRLWPETGQYLKYLAEEPYTYTYSYGSQTAVTDYYTRVALESFDRTYRNMLYGVDKRIDHEIGTKSFFKFDVPCSYDMSDEMKKCYAIEKDILIQSIKHHAFEPNFWTYPKQKTITTAAGFTFPGKFKYEVMDQAFNVSQYIKHGIKMGKKMYKPPCKLAFRGHLSSIEEGKKKVRSVWIYPFEIIMLESVFADPIIERFMEDIHMPFLSGREAFFRLSKVMGRPTRALDEVTITTDWKSFDQSIPPWQIHQAFDVLWSLYRFRDAREEKKYRRVFEYLKSYFINTKMMLNDGRVFQKHHGIPSGSHFTSIIGSIVNCLATRSLYRFHELNIQDDHYLGDDGIVRIKSANYYRNFDIDTFIASAKKELNLELHPDKVVITKPGSEAPFLGYEKNGMRFIRKQDEWFQMVLYTEHHIPTVQHSATRMVAIYLIGGCNNAYFDRFFHYYMKFWNVGQVNMNQDTQHTRKLEYQAPDIKRLGVVKISQLNYFNVAKFLTTPGLKPMIEVNY